MDRNNIAYKDIIIDKISDLSWEFEESRSHGVTNLGPYDVAIEDKGA